MLFDFQYSNGSAAGFSEKGVNRGWAYQNWAKGQTVASNEPNDYGNSEACVQMYGTGSWNDVNCFTTLPFVCEIDFVGGCSAGSRSTRPIKMRAGEARLSF